MTRRAAALALTLLAVLAAALGTEVTAASADGDPGSDVLVYESLFLPADAAVPDAQQVRLGNLLAAARRAGFPIRVAVIPSPQDLGAVTQLWRKPQAYAAFLGTELSLTYGGRLLIVMPNGFGFNWPGHSSAAAYRTLGRIPIHTADGGLGNAVQAAVSSLAAASGVKLSSSSQPTAAVPQSPSSPASTSAPASTGSGLDTLVAIVAVALLGAAGAAFLSRRWLLRWIHAALALLRPRPTVAFLAAFVVLAGGAAAALLALRPPSSAQSDALATNPYLDPGTPLSAPAPGFTLTDQLGHPVSLASFRGKVVLLAFNDSECTTLCPLTTTAMLDAKAMLGKAATQVQLLGVDANPKATSLQDVFSYSEVHGMLRAWHFLTGSLPQLQRVWHDYRVQAAVQGGSIAHSAALFVIDPEGRERKVYVTQQSYAAVGQLGQLLAREASRLLPGHPPVSSDLSYSQIGGTTPATTVTLPRAGGGHVRLGPGRAHLYAFFATWDQQITGLGAGLQSLGRYSRLARSAGLPPLDAVDEASVEPAGALNNFLGGLASPLPYPVALDRDGRLADGYEVESLPWLMLVSPQGRIAWYYSVAALGWPSNSYLVTQVREALAHAAGGPDSVAAARRQLAGSPAALAALHAQGGRLLGSVNSLLARARSLRGYPIVINAWASWCVPCQAEFGLFANASARYGRQVAFLGADTADSGGDAQSFLAQHPVSYPSYQTSETGLDPLVPQGLAGLPTTIFINRQGKLVKVHTGQYDVQGTLDGDIQTYVLGR